MKVNLAPFKAAGYVNIQNKWPVGAAVELRLKEDRFECVCVHVSVFVWTRLVRYGGCEEIFAFPDNFKWVFEGLD